MQSMTRFEEYRNLLTAQRALAKDIENKDTGSRERAMAAKVLVSVIDMKRTMRGIGKPKPVDTSKSKGRSAHTLAPVESAPDVQGQ